MSDAARMLAAFEGSKVAHGTTKVGRTGRTGKAEADSRIVREPLTVAKIEAHLSGGLGVGAIPINADNQCKWGALDIDVYDLDHKALQDKIQKLKLPFVHCRTKSGGAHLYLFLDQFYDAKDVREFLAEFAIALGHSGCEVFPKQDTILSDRGDVGNFINMPYQNADMTMRYAFDKDGEAMELTQFLDAIDANRASLSQLEGLQLSGKRQYFFDGPPCLEHLFADGPVPDERNKKLFNCGVYCRKKSPDDWVKEMEDMNRRLFTDPLGSTEVSNVQKSLEKKDYGYTCNDEPFKSHCDVVLCRKRKYGIDSNTPDMPKMGGLTILMSEPRLYFMDVDGHRIQLTTEQLQNQTLWQRAVMEQATIMPPKTKDNNYQGMVSEMLRDATRLDAPEELTVRGQFKEILRQYCTSRIRAMEPAELRMGKPWTEKGRTMFMMAGLEEFLRQRHFDYRSRAEIQEHLKAINGTDNCHGHKAIPKEGGKPSTVRVWWVPEFEDEDVDLDVKEIDNDVPF
jgi:hypothetical protein